MIRQYSPQNKVDLKTVFVVDIGPAVQVEASSQECSQLHKQSLLTEISLANTYVKSENQNSRIWRQISRQVE